MILHTAFLVDTSLSIEPIFEALVDEVLCPLAKGLYARATASCQFQFSLHTFPKGGCLLKNASAAGLEQALSRIELTGGAADGREILGGALAQVWNDLAPGPREIRYALCVVSDAPAFADAAGGAVSFAAPPALTGIVMLHHPECRVGLLPMDGAMPVSVSQAQYAIEDSLPDQIPEIVRKLSDTVLENSNLR